ncbi:MAG: pseudouridine synthase [Erysipelotrichaceae bacterium]
MAMIRLDKFLADMSYGTRTQVKKMIKEKRVSIDGTVIRNAELKIDMDTVVRVDDQEVRYQQYEHYLLYKPKGYLSATEDSSQPTVMELINSVRHDLFPVGRLDKDTTGLLIICNDGQLSHRLLDPDNHVDKKYYFTCQPALPENAKEILAKPISFADFSSRGGLLEKIDDYSGYLTIAEGKYHQVKRMIGFLGCEVTSLERVSFGFLNLDGLKIGEYRKLVDEEVKKLKELVNMD